MYTFRLRFAIVLSLACTVVGCSSSKSSLFGEKTPKPTGVEEEIVVSKREKEEPSSKMQIDFGIFFAGIGNNERAVECFREAIEMDRKSPQGYLGLSKIYMQMQHPDQAMKILEDGVKRCRKSPEIWNEIAVVHASQGRYEEALKAMKSTLKYGENEPRYIENHAGILAASGDYDQAVEYYSKILPPAEARFRVAGIAFNQGDQSQSKNQLQLALTANPAHSASREMLQRMEQGGIIQAGYVADPSKNELQSTK